MIANKKSWGNPHITFHFSPCHLLVIFQSFISLDILLFIVLYFLFTLCHTCPTSVLYVGSDVLQDSDPLTPWCKGKLSLLPRHSGLRGIWAPTVIKGQRVPIHEPDEQWPVIHCSPLHSSSSSTLMCKALYRVHWLQVDWQTRLKNITFLWVK